MAIQKPYPNIYRHGPAHVITPYYEAWKSPEVVGHFAAYNLLKADLRVAFQYIEPTPANSTTYSHRTFELLLRACTEVEALCKRVFESNKVPLSPSPNIIRFSDLDGPMRLHEYTLRCYGFDYPQFCPFQAFGAKDRSQRSPSWYRAYNAVKHHRSAAFNEASIANVINAVGAVHVLLVAQVGLGFDHVMRVGPTGGYLDCPDMFRPTQLPSWPESDSYQFNWQTLRSTAAPFDFHAIPEIPSDNAAGA